MAYKSSKDTAYKIRAVGKYNNLITVPKWVAATLGIGTNVYWHLRKGEVILSKDKPTTFEEPKQIKTSSEWQLALNKDNPSIYNNNKQIIYGFSKERNKYFVGRFKETPIYGDKSFINRALNDMCNSPIDDEVRGNFDAFCELAL